MLNRKLLATLTVIAATAVVPASAAARGSDPARVPTESNAAVTDGTSNTIAFARQSIAADGQGARHVLSFDSHTRPHADGIIAILIGAIATTDDRRSEDGENVPRPRP